MRHPDWLWAGSRQRRPTTLVVENLISHIIFHPIWDPCPHTEYLSQEAAHRLCIYNTSPPAPGSPSSWLTLPQVTMGHLIAFIPVPMSLVSPGASEGNWMRVWPRIGFLSYLPFQWGAHSGDPRSETLEIQAFELCNQLLRLWSFRRKWLVRTLMILSTRCAGTGPSALCTLALSPTQSPDRGCQHSPFLVRGTEAQWGEEADQGPTAGGTARAGS